MDVIAIEPPTERDWEEMIDGEQNPWRSAAAEALEWGGKEHFVGVRDSGGRLLATAGATSARVRVGEDAEFEVSGIGGVFVTRSARGQGWVAPLVEAILERARALGPEHAMLFCRPQLAPVYARFGFQLIAAGAWAEQPSGEVLVPMEAMHRPLAAGAEWPAGDVHVLGLPF